MSTEMIPFQINAQRVIELLATQIYQSPLALLRENTQNAFDAVRLRLHQKHNFQPRIDVEISGNSLSVSDNGIGMTPNDLREHYWKAGSSSKNNVDARAAGVVGTFGIGAMANFGIAETLVIETESAFTGERSLSKAEKAKLSLRDDCIELSQISSVGFPGTKVTAHIMPGNNIDLVQAKSYITEFVSLVDVPVYVNNTLVSRQPIERFVPVVPESWRHYKESEVIGSRLRADVTIVISNNAEIWIMLNMLQWQGNHLDGRIVLRSGSSVIRTFRSGFGLAAASVSSAYQFGGVVDLLILEPTAGREAVTVDGIQLLQSIVSEIDDYVSLKLSALDECDSSTMFISWIIAHNRYDLCRRLRMNISPGDHIKLGEVESMSKIKPLPLYEGTDGGFVSMHATDETPLLILARSNPRRQCEQQFLNAFCVIEKMRDAPVVKNVRAYDDLTIDQRTLSYRIESILDSDYFLKSVVRFADISHSLPVLVEKTTEGILLTLNPEGQSVKLLLSLCSNEFSAFGSLAKDFVRTIIFPKISSFVPSSTRQGAEAFLNMIRKPRDLFEYGDMDLGNLPRIWTDYDDGVISLDTAVERSKNAVRASIQVVNAAVTQNVHAVVPDVIQNEQALYDPDANGSTPNLDPSPAITRLEVESPAKLLVIEDNEPSLRGYRCFLALTDRAREEMGEFFLQPHRTSIVWGGQRTLFIFIHHSGQFGLYYDLQTREPIEATSGGGPFATSTLILRNRVYIPIPDDIRATFLPHSGETKRFEVRADILKTDYSAVS